MTNQEILQKAIEKAVENGYKIPNNGTITDLEGVLQESEQYPEAFMSFFRGVVTDKDFAKAFWGEDNATVARTESGDYLIECDPITRRIIRNWQYHLQQMVVSEDSVKYLAKFLD